MQKDRSFISLRVELETFGTQKIRVGPTNLSQTQLLHQSEHPQAENMVGPLGKGAVWLVYKVIHITECFEDLDVMCLFHSACLLILHSSVSPNVLSSYLLYRVLWPNASTLVWPSPVFVIFELSTFVEHSRAPVCLYYMQKVSYWSGMSFCDWSIVHEERSHRWYHLVTTAPSDILYILMVPKLSHPYHKRRVRRCGRQV